MSDTILLRDHDHRVEITLNRPDKLNRFNDEMPRHLRGCLEVLIADGKRAIGLTGAGRGFCAGQDLDDRGARACRKTRPRSDQRLCPHLKGRSRAFANTLEAQLDMTAQYQKTCGESADYADGFTAFLSNREPEFIGK